MILLDNCFQSDSEAESSRFRFSKFSISTLVKSASIIICSRGLSSSVSRCRPSTSIFFHCSVDSFSTILSSSSSNVESVLNDLKQHLLKEDRMTFSGTCSIIEYALLTIVIFSGNFPMNKLLFNQSLYVDCIYLYKP